MKLILGSSSKYRKDILQKAGYVFDIINPDVDEKMINVKDPYARPLVLARTKAEAVLAKMKKTNEPVLVIASDQVIICDGKLYEKPENEKEVRKFLEHYNNGGVPESLVAVVVLNSLTGEKYEGLDKAKVFFKKIPDTAIEAFIKKDEPLTRAGGFGIKDTALKPYVERIEGTEDSITGMPVHLLKELLALAGHF
jgi:septum formation protein